MATIHDTTRTIVRATCISTLLWWSLERVAPSVGAWWATQLWFTVPPAVRSATEAAAIPPGEVFTVDLDGRRVVGRAWGSGPVVYLVHGWGGRSGQLDGFVSPLVAAGHRVVAFDAPSHGRSDPGRWGPGRSTIPEFAAALDAVVREHGRPCAVIAHSLGCSATALAVRDGLGARRLIFLAPMADPRRVLAAFLGRLGAGRRIRARVEQRVARRVGLPWAAFDLPAMGRSWPTAPPLLVAHDRGDREVGFRDGVEISESWSGARLFATDGLGHRRILRDGAVIAEVVGFLSGHPCAAGRPL